MESNNDLKMLIVYSCVCAFFALSKVDNTVIDYKTRPKEKHRKEKENGRKEGHKLE